MTDPPQPPATPPRAAAERIDYTNPWVIAGGLLAFSVLLCAVPVFWVLLPVALAALTLLYFAFAGSRNKARRRARQLLGPSGATALDVEIHPGLTGTLVLNDWGVVLARWGRRPAELAWVDIRLVAEPAIAMLAFHASGAPDGAAPAFQVDLSQDRYFLAIQAIQTKIPGKTDFDVDAVSGQSRLLGRLQNARLEWQGKWGHFIATRAGVEHGQECLAWEEIESVRESFFPGDESESVWELRFTSAQHSFDLRSTDFADGRAIGNSGYDTIKALLALLIPGRVAFDRAPPLPKERAAREFKWCQEVTRAGLAVALKSGKVAAVENYFRHMRVLVDRYALDGAVDTATFTRDYADLLAATNRPDEAAQLRTRAVDAI